MKELFLDSGAFGAFTKGLVIDIQEYISFIKENIHLFSVYANLDIIGSPEGTLENQKIMEKAGLSPLPCFHYKEDPSFLEYYIENYDYVALGGMVGKGTSNLVGWLDEMFSEYICDKDGMPRCKVHGYGMTTLSLMFRYPWYSVDSTTWCQWGGYGKLALPQLRNGKPVWDSTPYMMGVTEPRGHMPRGSHMDAIAPKLREFYLEYIEQQGYSYEELVKDYRLRWKWNLEFFISMEDHLPPWPQPFKVNQQGFGL